jgi:iron complex transport system substrate-binding protein
MFTSPLLIETGVAVTRPPFSWRDFTPARRLRRHRPAHGGRTAIRAGIVCLTEETTETLYLLGEGDRVAGVSGYTVRPPEARRKPRVVGVPPRALRQDRGARAPDLSARLLRSAGDIAADLASAAYPVMLFNQRSIAEILQMILIVGGLVGRADRAAALVASSKPGSTSVRAAAARLPSRPRVFFEEWDAPLISASAGWKSS